MDTIEFYAVGTPQPKGSAKAWARIGNDGRPHASVTNDAGPKAKTWAAQVAWAAREAYRGDLHRGPVAVAVTFYLQRPKGHYRVSKRHGQLSALKPSAPKFPTVKPDLDKLTRNTMDALKGVVLADDSIIVDRSEHKRYADGCSVGAQIRIVPV